MLEEKFNFDWLKTLLALKLGIHIVSTAAPLIKSFFKTYRLNVLDVCQKANYQSVKPLFFLRRNTRGVFGRN